MTGLFEVVWSGTATADWMAPTLGDAEAVARTIRRFAETGEGGAVFVEGQYRLFVGSLVVAFVIDGDTLHVDRVRRRQ